MTVQNLVQGTAEWHQFRLKHYPASETPAMLGISPYKSRNQLIKERATGIRPEVDAFTQKRFDDGHRAEALARPIAESVIGEELYPVTKASGKFSASFDGLTMLENIAWEHKHLNDTIRDALAKGEIPEQYRAQMEHQCLVSGCEKVLFMASAWNGSELIEERHAWYTPDPEMRKRIIAGWEQLDKDVQAYTPEAAHAEPVAKTMASLPALKVEVSGQVLATNLDAFKAHALAIIDGVNTDLQTDQDFADAEAAVKWLKNDVAGKLKAAKDYAMSQMADVDALYKAIDSVIGAADAQRLKLEKLVKARKEEIKAEMIRAGQKIIDDHVATLNARIGEPLMPRVAPDFAGAIRNLRTRESLKNAIDNTVAQGRITANEIADKIQVNLRTIEAAGNGHLFPDKATLVQKSADDLAATIESRIAHFEKSQSLSEKSIRDFQEESKKADARRAEEKGDRLDEVDLNKLLWPVSVSILGLANYGIKPEKGGYFRKDQISAILQAIIKHIEGIKNQQ